MTNLKIIGKTEEGIIIKSLTEAEYKAIPELIKIVCKIDKIEGNNITLKIINEAEFKKKIIGLNEQPIDFQMIHREFNKLNVGATVTLFGSFIY